MKKNKTEDKKFGLIFFFDLNGLEIQGRCYFCLKKLFYRISFFGVLKNIFVCCLKKYKKTIDKEYFLVYDKKCKYI